MVYAEIAGIHQCLGDGWIKEEKEAEQMDEEEKEEREGGGRQEGRGMKMTGSRQTRGSLRCLVLLHHWIWNCLLIFNMNSLYNCWIVIYLQRLYVKLLINCGYRY